MRSGRKSIQLQNDHALLQQIGPVLSESLVMKEVPGIQIASYMVVTILAAKGSLEDSGLTAFMDQLVHGWTAETIRPGLYCLCTLSQYRSAKQVSAKVAKALLKVPNLVSLLGEIHQSHKVDRLTNGLAIALVERLAKKGDARGLPIVSAFLTAGLISEKHTKLVYKTLLVAAHKITDDVDKDGHVRKELGSVLVSMSHASGELGEIIRDTIEEVDFSIEELELKLETAVRPKLAIEAPTENAPEHQDSDMADDQQHLEAAFVKLSGHPAPKTSCLSKESLSLFDELSAFFLLAAASENDTQRFDGAPVLSRSEAPTKSFYLSFYVRIWCGPFPTLAKAAALDRVKIRIKEEDFVEKDLQALIPYCIAALGDPAKRVRRAAADLVAVLGQSLTVNQKAARQVWGAKDLYGKAAGPIPWLEPEAAKALVSNVLLPSLEESVLHEDHISATLTNSLESSHEGKESGKKHISKASRLSILKFLCGHVLEAPIFMVKLRLLKPLNQVRSNSDTKTDLLLPLLRWWAGLSKEEEAQVTAVESIDELTVGTACVDIVAAKSASGLELLFELVKLPQLATRPHLLDTVFKRIQKIWSSMKAETQFQVASDLLGLSQTTTGTSGEPTPVAVEAADLLRKIELSTDILLHFLASMQNDVQLATEPPASKRRRVSASDHATNTKAQISTEYDTTISKIRFVLELVQESNPEKHPEMLPSLFTVLSDLQHLRSAVGSELGYLQNLVLSSLLAMMPAYHNNKALVIDPSVGHGDILASCIQKSTSPTVINAALLLVASLARTAPDVVLHSVMPIFTFMGGSVLRQADDYSAHVVNQTVKEVIPPLIENFRKTRRNLIASTSELLSSFVIAYEHIPSHRKQDLFVSLVENLGPEDFLFAVLAMFVDKYGTTDSMISFTTNILGSFAVEIQLQTLIKLLDLVGDVFKPKPALSSSLLGKGGSGDVDPAKLAGKQLALLPHLLSNRRLKKEITLLAERDDMDSVKIRDLYATLLESLLSLAAIVKSKKQLHNRCGDALSNLLNLLSMAEFIKSVETLLDRPNVELRQKVLRALELRVDKESNTDPKSRAALLAFLPQLTAVIRESDDMNYKHTAVTCVDKIAEKYGKKDLEAVAAAATTIAGDHCLGQSSETLRVMALLCLASLVDVLQDGIVPVLPVAIPKALGYLEQSLQGEAANAELHNAAYAFMTALAQHIPYMISGAYLERLLVCSYASAAAGLDTESNQCRLDCLQFLAKLVEPKALFVALDQTWSKASAAGFMVRQYPTPTHLKQRIANEFQALTEQLRVLGMALDKYPKLTVAKNLSALTAILLKALDLRRQLAAQTEVEFTPTQLDQFESAVNDCALKMIYKLNDAAFRPIFSQLVEWSSQLPKQDVSGKALRQLSLYGFFYTFFSSLKSIVTSYASYISDEAAKTLIKSDLKDAAQRELWKRILRSLAQCFEHDQDEFWQAPAHFGAVAPVLIEQFQRAGSVDVAEELVPTVVELGAAADSKEHHKELNGSLLKLLRSEQAAVRLGVVKCQQALTDRLGQEWLANLPEMLPYISELQDDDDETVERENRRWIVKIEQALGESLDSMLQ
ncbi:hypothetical protein OQA88_438 [Cercophora sp. LCS_1]